MLENEQPGGQAGKPSAIERLVDRLSDLCLLFAGILLVILITIFGWLVFGRYVLNSTPTWVEQASLLLVVYITFLGAAVGVHRGTHLGIDFVREAMPALPRKVLQVVSDISLIAFGFFMAWQGWLLLITNLRRKVPLLGLSEAWRAAPLVLCGVLIVLFVTAGLYRRLRAFGR